MAEEPPWIASLAKRGIDIIAASAGLIIFLPLMITLALLLLATEGPPLLYREQRLGRYGRLFPLYKFRTLRAGSGEECSVAPEDDPRITGSGLSLRRWRLDEFPQLLNVLCGHMSLVGPRPMPPAHGAALPREQLEELLSVRPGITDAAAIHFLAEDAVLAGREDAETLYLQCLLPVKARMQVASLRRWSLAGDLRVVMCTLTLLWSRRARDESAREMREILKTATAVSPASPH